MTTALVVVAMEAEARPIRAALGVPDKPRPLHPAFPSLLTGSDHRFVATNGRDTRFDVDAIASQPAVVTTLMGCELLDAEGRRPDVIVSAGTAGGFAAKNADIGDVYLATDVVFHDRRIPIPGWDEYGIGHYPVLDLGFSPTEIGAKPGIVTTGNSLDAPDIDRQTMHTLRADAKDMEAAAVAWVAHQMGIGFVALKAITDLVDDPEPTADQFDRNLASATAGLAEVVARLFDRAGW